MKHCGMSCVCHVIISIIIDNLHEQLASTDDMNIVAKIFGGTLSSTIVCKKCGQVCHSVSGGDDQSSSTSEPFYDLSLSIPNKKYRHKVHDNYQSLQKEASAIVMAYLQHIGDDSVCDVRCSMTFSNPTKRSRVSNVQRCLVSRSNLRVMMFDQKSRWCHCLIHHRPRAVSMNHHQIQQVP